MKKLLDENTDDLTRALLEAGRSHRPPATSQAKLLVALGVGSSLGLLSSKAFAWLGTTSGKLTLLSAGVVGVGVASALYGAAPTPAPYSEAVSSEAVSSEAVSSEALARVEARLSPVEVSSAQPAQAAELSKFVPAHVADAPSDTGRDPVAGLPAVNEGPARRQNAPAACESPHRTARARKGSAVRRDDVRARLEAQDLEDRRTGHLPAVSPPPAGLPSGVSTPNAELASNEPRRPGLDSELQLVDAMRGAAQRNDTRALRGLVESYRGTFPDGQLREEVTQLASRALPAER